MEVEADCHGVAIHHDSGNRQRIGRMRRRRRDIGGRWRFDWCGIVRDIIAGGLGGRIGVGWRRLEIGVWRMFHDDVFSERICDVIFDVMSDWNSPE